MEFLDDDIENIKKKSIDKRKEKKESDDDDHDEISYAKIRVTVRKFYVRNYLISRAAVVSSKALAPTRVSLTCETRKLD